MKGLFTKIIQGEIPSYKVAETETCYAFLDIRPQTKGHTLCIPKIEVDYIYDMEDEALADLMLFSKRVAKAMKHVIPCKRIGIAVIGLEVPHAHVHLFPLNKMSDFGFGKKPAELTSTEMTKLANDILTAFV